MTPDPLLQAILADPDDDALRLVYADWLQERGDPAGEFIHIQCVLARLPASDPRRPLLEAREKQLLLGQTVAWNERLGELQGIRWEFERGLPGAIKADSCTAFRKHAPLLFSLAPIQRVTFRRLSGVKGLATCPYLVRVKALDLSGIPLYDRSVQILAASPHLGRLTELRLPHTQMGDAGAQALVASPHLGRLLRLILAFNQIGDAGARALLASADRLERLEHLSLAGNPIGDRLALLLYLRFGHRLVVSPVVGRWAPAEQPAATVR
jgi:uncharacterized protein (TIGR02996 family)